MEQKLLLAVSFGLVAPVKRLTVSSMTQTVLCFCKSFVHANIPSATLPSVSSLFIRAMHDVR